MSHSHSVGGDTLAIVVTVRFDEEHEGDHRKANDAEKPEHIDESQHGSLTLKFSVKDCTRLLRSVRRI